MDATAAFRSARDFLLESDHDTAYREFRWPTLDRFNWAVHWFDAVLAAETPDTPALTIVEDDGGVDSHTFAQLSVRSSRLANWLHAQGVRRGDRILLMLGNQVELWETILAAMKLGATLIPATTLLTAEDLADRIDRGAAAHVITDVDPTGRFAGVPGDYTRIAVGGEAYGWLTYDAADDFPAQLSPAVERELQEGRADDT